MLSAQMCISVLDTKPLLTKVWSSSKIQLERHAIVCQVKQSQRVFSMSHKFLSQRIKAWRMAVRERCSLKLTLSPSLNLGSCVEMAVRVYQTPFRLLLTGIRARVPCEGMECSIYVLFYSKGRLNSHC